MNRTRMSLEDEKKRKTQEIDVECGAKRVKEEQLEAKPAVWNSDQMEMNFSSAE